VIDHVAQRDRKRRLVALDHVAERIADEDRVHARGIEHARKARVVARELGDPVAFLHHLVQSRERDAHGP
jgi:hypothetical protein